MGKKEKWVKKGVFSRVFRKPKTEELSPAMEEEIESEVKGIEPGFLKDIDTGRKTGDVPYELRFWVSDGRILKNSDELTNALKTMNKETFKYHVNRDKNDFSTWVKEVLGNNELAEKLGKARTQKDMLAVFSKKLLAQVKMAKPKVTKGVKTVSKTVKSVPKVIKTVPRPVKKQSTFKQLAPKIQAKPAAKSKIRRAREWEQDLLNRENALNEEEQRLNEKKLLLSKKRVALLKEKSELEKQKFEKFISGKGTPIPKIEASTERIEEVEVDEQKTRNSLNETIAQVKAALENNKTEEAHRLIMRAREFLNVVYLENDERKRIEYQILELEADVKLAVLSTQ